MANKLRLETYHQVENNSLKGLQPGFVVAQMEVATDAGWDVSSLDVATGAKFASGMFENGELCSISSDGILPAASDSKVVFLHYTEPLNTIRDGAKFFAVDLEEENPRLVQLIPGDEWMCDIEPSATNYAALISAGRIVNVTSAAKQYYQDEDWYEVNKMADETTGYHYMFLG